MRQLLLSLISCIVLNSSIYGTPKSIDCDSLGIIINDIFTNDLLDRKETAIIAPPLYEE